MKLSSIASADHNIQVGAGLQITPNASRLLQYWKVGKQFWNSVAEPTSVSVHRYSGQLLAHEDDFHKNIRRKYGAPFIDVHRADLQQALLIRAQELNVEFHLGEKVISIDFGSSEVSTEIGHKYRGDLIVAADGLWSRCRELFLKSKDGPLPTGDLAYRIVLSLDELQDEDLRKWVESPTVHFWIGPGAHAVAYSIKAGKMYNIVLLCPDTLPEGSSREAGSVDEMNQLFATWDPM